MKKGTTPRKTNLMPPCVSAEYVVSWNDNSGEKHTAKVGYLKHPGKFINK